MRVGAFAVAYVAVPYFRPGALFHLTNFNAAAGGRALLVTVRTAFSWATTCAFAPVPELPRRTSFRSISAFATAGRVP